MKITCTICTNPLPPPPQHTSSHHHHPKTVAVTFPCTHIHCLPCLRRNYTLSTTPIENVPFRPVQCCPNTRLPLPILRHALGLNSAEVASYRARLAEYDSPVKLYCFDRVRCGRFIPTVLRDGRVGRCRGCWGRTCVRCGGRAHSSSSSSSSSGGRCEGGGDVGKGGGVGRRKSVEEEEFRRVVREMGW
ncbi:hypothetical protein C8A01DRAFT_38264 [Parachaetomium inaequale]|uniref:RING-type domain-containing protein n=1 Tax=Parachaetomium inaequale TaxID=2588326 RepID=A0AAN6PD65_9PEZI|nr:hypothetical protein C8A01DRAFT_38264 [Parachaetomium inaequale]